MRSDPEETARPDLGNLMLVPGMWVKSRIQRFLGLFFFFLIIYKQSYCGYTELETHSFWAKLFSRATDNK